MKLKFRADPKDWLIFCLFAIFLLYFIAISVGNVIFLVRGIELPGMNPIPAFEGDLFPVTMIIYLIVLIIVFTSVSSYFFDREKGLGISTSPKKEKGYSRWATDKEMKQHLKKVDPKLETSDVAGIPLINNGKEIWVDAGEWHNLVIGSTASGKTESIVQPMVKTLAKAGESMIITDPKGEIYERNANELREKGYNIVLLNFRNPQNGNCWNPLTLPYSLYKAGNIDKATELLDDLAKNILYDESSKGQDPFWENTSADYFTGLSLALFEDAKEEQINLNTINLMTTVGEEKIGGTTIMKEYFSDKDQSSPAYINVASTLMAPADTKGSILSVFKQKIKIFSSKQNLSEMLSHSDFEMADIGRKKTAVFIIIHDEKKTYHPLATIFVKQCYETLVDVAFENGGKLPFKTNFILDEFANMPPLKDADAMVTAARSRLIRFTFIIQNFAQLTEVYGKEKGDTIKGNCGNWIYLISSELSALEEISKMCGEVKSKKDDKTASTPLITVSDLQRLPMYTMVILRTREMPFKTKMVPAWKMDKEGMWGKNYPKATYPQREKGKIQLFDIKKVVEEKRQKKIDEMLGSDLPKMPNMPGMSGIPNMPPFNPFENNKKSAPNFDEIVKKIDAKIAELEEEERQEKLKEEQKKQEKKVEKVIEPEKEEPITFKQEEVTDDQFFDDFFADDE
ncbi:MAG: type IV secretory system conjugative DNA transfer family protein [Tenericutes bacterium]|nr:type IV secretory system conjugative DNA transfer family protein [Mycoplasmatota bacterium]